MKFLNSILTAISIAGLTACASTPLTATPKIERTNAMLTIITSDDPETQLMALVLTRSAMDAGEHPHILLCSAGGDLALKEAPASAVAPLQPKGASPQGLLKMLMSIGVGVEVCAIYLPNRPFGTEALLDGVEVAKPEDMGARIAASGETILSF